MNKYNVVCPKCESENVVRKSSFGGFNVYARLECADCGFEGGRSTDYTGEEARVEREIVERFALERRDAVKEFVDTIV